MGHRVTQPLRMIEAMSSQDAYMTFELAISQWDSHGREGGTLTIYTCGSNGLT